MSYFNIAACISNVKKLAGTYCNSRANTIMKHFIYLNNFIHVISIQVSVWHYCLQSGIHSEKFPKTKELLLDTVTIKKYKTMFLPKYINTGFYFDTNHPPSQSSENQQ